MGSGDDDLDRREILGREEVQLVQKVRAEAARTTRDSESAPRRQGKRRASCHRGCERVISGGGDSRGDERAEGTPRAGHESHHPPLVGLASVPIPDDGDASARARLDHHVTRTSDGDDAAILGRNRTCPLHAHRVFGFGGSGIHALAVRLGAGEREDLGGVALDHFRTAVVQHLIDSCVAERRRAVPYRVHNQNAVGGALAPGRQCGERVHLGGMKPRVEVDTSARDVRDPSELRDLLRAVDHCRGRASRKEHVCHPLRRDLVGHAHDERAVLLHECPVRHALLAHLICHRWGWCRN
mmetsp:Transcript_62834/g.149700  ORF Transcript_62834/g.149700 Transcript_62834/m.149700 type:complete len:297 (-) Transcript_62834:38-928(-)